MAKQAPEHLGIIFGLLVILAHIGLGIICVALITIIGLMLIA